MEKIIVNPLDHKSPEVFHNDAIFHGMYSEDYKHLVKKEDLIAQLFLDIATTGKLPKLVEIAITERNDEQDKTWINDVQVVCQKVIGLMVEGGFHARIIIDMLRCGTGRGCNYSHEFQRKFEAAMNKEVRKDFWGTEKRIPLVVAEDLLYDMLERGVDVYNPDLEKSYFYEEFVTNYLDYKKRKRG